MTQEISKPTSTAMTMPAEKNIYEQYADAVNRQRIIGDLLKFNKGEWIAGRDPGIEVEEGTELVAGCDKMEYGWVKWADFKPVEYKMGRLSEGFVPPKRQDLDDKDDLNWPRDEATGQPRDPWQASNSLILMNAESRQLYTFAAASKGATGAVAKLMGIYGKHVRQAPSQLPVVALESDSYKHSNKAYGRIQVPVFKVVKWIDRAEFDSVLEGATDGLEEHEAEEPAQIEKPSPSQDYAAVKGRRGRPRKVPLDDEEVPF